MTCQYSTLPEEALAELDARLSTEGQLKWNAFFADRARPCPFFKTKPDENLHRWVTEGRVRPGLALDLGCGNGRNAIFLARHGFAVRAVDYSASALDWAAEEVRRADVSVDLQCSSVFDVRLQANSCDLVYDSGCFHHVAPHRRHQYVEFVANALKPGGAFGLVCFTLEGGSGLSDEEVYARASMGGGLGYDEARLRKIWSGPLEVRSLERQREQAPHSATFGKCFLWSMLAFKR